MRHRVEDLDAVAGGHVQIVGIRIGGHSQFDPLAVARDDLAGVRVELHQRSAASGGPELAIAIEGHVVDGLAKGRQRRRGRALPPASENSHRLLRPRAADVDRLPLGEKAIPSGLMSAPDGANPVTSAPTVNGSSTVLNAGGLTVGAGVGTPCSANRNSGLVEGCVGGGGEATVGLGGGAVGRLPRLICGS